MDLDSRTLNALTTILSLIVAIAIAYVAKGYPSGMRRYVRTWALALGVFALGWGLMAARGRIPDGASVVLANLAIQLGLFGLLVAMRDFFHLPRWRPRDVVPSLAIVAGCAWFLYVEPSLDARVVVITLATAVILGEALALLLRHSPRPAPRPHRLLAACLGLLLVLLVLRCVVQLTVAPATGLHVPNPAQSALFLLSNLAPLVATLGFLLAIADRLQSRLHDLASSDPLTGLANRRQLEARARNLPALGLLAIDVDHFKPINDRHGHAVGDEVLVQLAARIAEAAPDDALAIRLGGEEFVLLLPGHGPAEALAEAERLRERIAATPCDVDGLVLPLTVSIGVACGVGGDAGLRDALRRADAALSWPSTRGAIRSSPMPPKRSSRRPSSRMPHVQWRDECACQRKPRRPPEDRAPLEPSLDLPEDGGEAADQAKARQHRRSL